MMQRNDAKTCYGMVHYALIRWEQLYARAQLSGN